MKMNEIYKFSITSQAFLSHVITSKHAEVERKQLILNSVIKTLTSSASSTLQSHSHPRRVFFKFSNNFLEQYRSFRDLL